MFPMKSVLLFAVLMCGFEQGVLKYILPLDELQFEKLKSSKNIMKPGKLCLKKICNETASEILKNMDVTANPCDDFFQFACGGWIKSAVIPDGFNNIGIFHQKNEIFMYQLEMSLNETIKEDEPRPLKMVKSYFKSCIDESGIEKNSVDSLHQIMKSVGGWPLIEGDKWNETNFDWIKSLYKLQKMGYFIDNMPQVYVDRSVRNKTQRAIYLRRDPSDVLFHPNADNRTINILQEDFVNITVELGANHTFAQKEVRELFNFVSRLHDLNNNTNANYKFEEFLAVNKSFGGFPVKNFIEKIILPFSKIKNNNVIFWARSIDDLKIIMENTPKRVQANYIIWSVISQSVESLKNDIREKYEKLLNDGGFKSSMEKYPSRSEECISVVEQSMPVCLSALYIRNYFDRNMKKDTIRILENIRRQVVKNLEESKSLSPRMKNIFRNKIEKVETFVAYHIDFFNDTELEELDKDLDISSSNDYLHNNINLMRFMMGKTFTKLHKSIEKIDTSNFSWNYLKNKIQWDNVDILAFYLYYTVYNTWHDSQSNSVLIPAAYLQGTMNKIENPEYIKYGATGFLMGHEFYHVLDNEARIVNEDNENIDFDNSTKEIFHQQDECLINQYGNISLGDTKLDGQTLLQENIADHGGFKAAYQAYSDWASKQDEPELLLPNLPYTPKQMVWISAMNNFCLKEKNSNSYKTEDRYLPDTVRFPIVFSNIPEFAIDFHCTVGSKMNPVNRCFV